MYWKYFKYVIRHKLFVFIECYKLGKIWRGITHDLSKFLPDEFIPYSRYFYGNWPTHKEVSQITHSQLPPAKAGSLSKYQANSL